MFIQLEKHFENICNAKKISRNNIILYVYMYVLIPEEQLMNVEHMCT